MLVVNVLNPFDPKSRLYKKNWIYFLAVGIFVIISGFALQTFFPPHNNTDIALDFFFVGLGLGLLTCADVTRKFEKRLP
jgi:uncharacterized membrane protein